MKATLTHPSQGWFLLSALGEQAMAEFKKMKPEQLAATGRLLVWMGKELDPEKEEKRARRAAAKAARLTAQAAAKKK